MARRGWTSNGLRQIKGRHVGPQPCPCGLCVEEYFDLQRNASQLQQVPENLCDAKRDRFRRDHGEPLRTAGWQLLSENRDQLAQLRELWRPILFRRVVKRIDTRGIAGIA